MTTQAFGHYLQFRGGITLNFQNYWIGENIGFQGVGYVFLPFGFSGVTVTRSGDNQPATLTFPNNQLTRAWIETAVRSEWLATVRTLLIDPSNRSGGQVLSIYSAQVVAGSWNDTSVELRMASVLDAVGADIPNKRLTKQLAGNLPLTSRVRLQ